MLIVICGATASGKSGLALEIAQRLDSVIISADSRQIYREFDLGTAKPSLAEQKLVTHYQIDICNPTETLTLAEYQQQTQQIIAASNGIPLIGRRYGTIFRFHYQRFKKYREYLPNQNCDRNLPASDKSKFTPG